MTRVYIDMTADGFSAAHVELLRAARSLGDALVVGVHADDDCEWFCRRPQENLDQRIRAVAACPFVDRVASPAPVFLSHDWLREQKIDLVAHSSGLSESALRYWYGVPIELGTFRTLPVNGHSETADLEGWLRAWERLPEPESASLASITRGQLRQWTQRGERAILRRFLVSGLRRLADTLQGTPLDGRYWIVGGLLLGWAREGRPLASDLEDADFAYLDEDHDLFLAAVPAIVRAGFTPAHRFSSADGRYVIHRFFRRGIKFEFFRLTPRADCWRYSMFESGKEPTELLAEVPAQMRVPFRFVGRTWRKVLDHELALRRIYGDWGTDRPWWKYTSDGAIVDRIPMAILPYGWAWPRAVARGPGERLSKTNATLGK